MRLVMELEERAVGKVRRAVPLDAEHREEGVLAGRISGLLYLLGGVTFAACTALPGRSHLHYGVVVILSALAAAFGGLSLKVIDWRRRRPWLMHFSIVSALILIAIGVASSGGAMSVAWMYLFFVIVFVAYFYRPRATAIYTGLVILVQALPLLYDSRATSAGCLSQLFIAAASYAALAVSIQTGKALTARLRRHAEDLASEQSALRRVATAVVDGQPSEEIYELVCRETAQLLGARGAGVLRVEGSEAVRVVSSWAEQEVNRYQIGALLPLTPESPVGEAIQTGRAARREQSPATARRMGYGPSIATPIRVNGCIWGVLSVAGGLDEQLSDLDQDRLEELSELLATSIASLEDRAKLAAQASSDPLTGLANHRTLHERLTAEVARVRRHGGVLSVAVLDVDNFKQFNDLGGHIAGDRLLVSVAECLGELARAEDILGRVGGDEFAWILPQTSRQAALVAVERARQLVSRRVREPTPVTLSAGICDTTVTDDPTELTRLADGALYWSKAHGRDQCWIYDPGVVAELSAQERAERLSRSQALLGLRALARAIDAKDPATRQHSERVSKLAGRLAQVAGWSQERALMLGEAALVHDVGKIGVPDITLRKVDQLSAAERAQIRGHAELSARIVEGVLSDDQVEWIRTHHERPDGTGYPRGLLAAEIPEGGALLALADAWDVMTVSRPYSLPKSVPQALAECRSLVGRQFTLAAVAALEELHARGELGRPELHGENGAGADEVAGALPRAAAGALGAAP